MADCNETLHELHAFLDDELTTDTRQAIEHHLNGCTDCLQAFDFHAELKLIIRQKCHEDAMPPDLVAKLERCFDTDFDLDGEIG